MARLGSASAIKGILERAEGRFELVLLTAEELDSLYGNAKEIIADQLADGNCAYYGKYGGLWCLIAVGPSLGWHKLSKTKWNYTGPQRQGPEWLVMNPMQKPKKPNDKAEIDEVMFGLLCGGVTILGEVKELDRFGNVETVQPFDGAEQPIRWCAIDRQDCASSLVSEGRSVFATYPSFATTMRHRRKLFDSKKKAAPKVSPIEMQNRLAEARKAKESILETGKANPNPLINWEKLANESYSKILRGESL